ncbi:MAG: MmgE/PrpD family protein [Variibacter sp.]|uniref:MmgE/PrpD family protein n=1 Tax=Pseudorhodoplanes sp. TaxID=1934341 RepID=UPI003D0E37F9
MTAIDVKERSAADTAEPMPVALRFADLAIEQSNCGQPKKVIHDAKRCIIDWFAASLPGAVSLQARALENGLVDGLGVGNAWTLSGRRAPARLAALINGTASHAVEFDDIFAPAIFHPGSPTIAAALSAAQSLNKTGLDLIVSVIAGYEVSTRIGEAMGRNHYKYWHNTGTVGCFGAAAAVGLLHDLDRQKLANALSTAATMAAGLQQAFRGDAGIKPLHSGHAADAGHVAVASAAGGVLAAPDMIEGDCGFGAAMGRNVDWDAVLRNTDYNISRTTIKNHGCCGHIFAALDGVLHLQERHGFTAENVAGIEIGGYSATFNVTGNYRIDTPAAAKFSLPFIVASGIVHKSIRLDAATPQRLSDPRVLDLMPRIVVRLDPDIDKLFPAQRAAKVSIRLKDGSTLDHFQPHRVGDPELPLDDKSLNDKFMELASCVMPKKDSEALLEHLWTLETSSDLSFTHALKLKQ